MERKLRFYKETFVRPDAGCTRRQVLFSTVGLAASFTPIANIKAYEERWYDNIFRQGNSLASISDSDDHTSSDNSDLRTGTVPLLSENMLARLDKAILHYTGLVKSGGWPLLQRARFLRQGRSHETIAIVRKQLIAMGDMDQSHFVWSQDLNYFDECVATALKRFQKRHGLRITGHLDRSTRYHLSYSALDRLERLKQNRNRLSRLLIKVRSGPYILVNIPGYQLEAVSQNTVERRHIVIVGRADRQTPEMTAAIRGVNFFPYWRVPQSIARRDLIPRARSDIKFLAEQRFRITTGSFSGPELDANDVDWTNITEKKVRFRQDPGPWNALGLVRINMPNKDIIYLHDTPMKSLFKRQHRAFSAGCIRVHNVMDLVAWIGSRHQDLKREAIDRLIETTNPVDLRERRSRHLNFNLKQPLPVHLAYLTAWVEDSGAVIFHTDVYNRDRKHDCEFSPLENPLQHNELSP